MIFCDVNRDGFIDYLEFSNFLNWKDKMSPGVEDKYAGSDRPKTHCGSSRSDIVEKDDLVPKSPASNESTPRRLQKQIDRAIGEHRTISSMINAVVGGVSTKDFRTYGIPTIRADVPAPRFKRISDNTNYGDESDAYGLLNPSIFSQYGVHEKHLLKPRTKEEVKDIFAAIGVLMTGETFDTLWETATKRHRLGHVSVESFRNVLDELQAARVEEKISSARTR